MRLVRPGIFALLYYLITGTTPLQGQNYPKDYFRYPMDSLPNYVSPFGGLRDNHFHSGADLRTNGKEGMAVYAAADGYISRIKVQRGGYGKALYIEHPNGYSTVYGHLQSYSGAIGEWIHTFQYVNQTFEFDKIFLKPFLKVKKGDTIGISGNSGTSSGPHLHFEIRDSRTEKIINPGLFGLLPFDTLAPAIYKLHFYKFVSDGLILKKKFVPSNKNLVLLEGNYWLKDTLDLDPDLYGIGAEVYDFVHNGKDEKAIYSIEIQLNGKRKFLHRMDQFAFDETKFINAHIDYPFYKLEKSRVQKCFVDDGNKFSTYTTDADRGRIRLRQGERGNLRMEVSDVNGNICRLILPYRCGTYTVDIDREKYMNSVSGKPTITPGRQQTLSLEGIEIKTEPGTVYDTVYYDLSSMATENTSWSREFRFHTPITPVHSPFEIALKVESVPKELQSKLLLGYTWPKSENLRSAGGAYEKGWVRGKGTQFGNYCVVLDTVAPKVKMFTYRNPDNKYDTLRWDFDIRDNFSGINSWQVWLNGRWILTDFDAKKNLVTYRFDEVYFEEKERISTQEMDPDIPRGLRLKIRVVDGKQNKTERDFFIPVEPKQNGN